MKTLFFNGNFITLNPESPLASWVVVDNGKIICAGRNQAPLVSAQKIKKVDLKKQFITPGLEDSHVHFLDTGFSKSITALGNLTSKKSALELIKNNLEGSSGDILWGQGWNNNLWKDEYAFSIKDLPSTNKPIILFSYDRHALLVNKVVLNYCNITSETISPYGGEIKKDGNSNPTGILTDTAMNLVLDKFNMYDEQKLNHFFKEAEKYFLSNGIVKIHDMSNSSKTINALKDLYKKNKLKIKTYSFITAENLDFENSFPKFKTEKFEIAGIKVFIDGAFTSRTASLLTPYLNSKSKGQILLNENLLEKYITYGIKNNIQLSFHAIGDGGARFILNSIDKFKNKDVSYKRWRLEHASMIDFKDEILLKNLKIIPSIQPCHHMTDVKWIKNHLSKEQMEKTYRWDRLKKICPHICIGTDSPIEPSSPIRNFIAALNKKMYSLSPLEILKGYTTAPAYATFKENSRGMIKEGFDADFTLFSMNPLKGNYENIKITGTIIDGERFF